ncbi:ribonuclease H-like domain-containing protein [Tanacetum coccineum]
MDTGASSHLAENTLKDYQTHRLLLRCDSTGNLYPVTLQTSTTTLFALLNLSLTTWHRRLGHLSDDVLRRLQSSSLISCNKSKLSALCHACQLGKHTKLPFYSSESNVAPLFDIIHSDLWTSPISSECGIKYYAIFLDHFSHYVWVSPLLHKSDLFDTFMTFRAYVNKQFSTDIKALQCDHGGEFDNTRFHTLFHQHAQHRGYRCLDLSTNKIIISRHVIFDEDQFPFRSMTPDTPPSYDFLLPLNAPLRPNITPLTPPTITPNTTPPILVLIIPSTTPLTSPTHSPQAQPTVAHQTIPIPSHLYSP